MPESSGSTYGITEFRKVLTELHYFREVLTAMWANRVLLTVTHTHPNAILMMNEDITDDVETLTFQSLRTYAAFEDISDKLKLSSN